MLYASEINCTKLLEEETGISVINCRKSHRSSSSGDNSIGDDSANTDTTFDSLDRALNQLKGAIYIFCDTGKLSNNLTFTVEIADESYGSSPLSSTKANSSTKYDRLRQYESGGGNNGSNLMLP